MMLSSRVKIADFTSIFLRLCASIKKTKCLRRIGLQGAALIEDTHEKRRTFER
jgi:hypothetical protein